jgi:hypothetical protein
MKNKLTDLNDHLFAQLERLSDETLEGEKLNQEIKRSTAVANVAREIIQNGRTVLRAQELCGDIRTKPAMLGIEYHKEGVQ